MSSQVIWCGYCENKVEYHSIGCSQELGIACIECYKKIKINKYKQEMKQSFFMSVIIMSIMTLTLLKLFTIR